MSEIPNLHHAAADIEVLSDKGSGRTFITIVDDESYLPFAKAVVDSLATRARSVLLQSSSVTAASWQELSEGLNETLSKLNVRQASVVGMGAGATLAQNLALIHPKMVRSLAIVDSSSRPHPTRFERIVDWFEERLPFGLPLRLGSTGFNVKAYVHRLRCPLLVIATSRASAAAHAAVWAASASNESISPPSLCSSMRWPSCATDTHLRLESGSVRSALVSAPLSSRHVVHMIALWSAERRR